MAAYVARVEVRWSVAASSLWAWRPGVGPASGPGSRLPVRRRAARGNPADARSPGFKFTSGLESVIGGKLVLGVVLGLVDGNESIKLKNEVCMPRCGPPAGRLVADPGFGPGRVRTG